MLRKMILGALVTVTLMGAAAGAAAQVSVSIGINLPTPPHLVAVRASPVMYAPAVEANYFFYGGQYYVFTDGFWYVGRRHNGPWAIVRPEFIPRPILAVPVKYYRAPPAQWRHWRREGPPQWTPTWGRRWEERHERRHGALREEFRDGREGPGGHDKHGRDRHGG